MRALLLAIAMSVAAAYSAVAVQPDEMLEDPLLEKRARALSVNIRCLVCQNQSLIDSDAELAHDLRAEVYGMMKAGNTDTQIIEFLVARYGDFVLYSPPVRPSTWLIWFGPFVLLLVAVLLLIRSLRRQQHAPQQAISGADRERLEQLLSERNADEERPS